MMLHQQQRQLSFLSSFSLFPITRVDYLPNPSSVDREHKKKKWRENVHWRLDIVACANDISDATTIKLEKFQAKLFNSTRREILLRSSGIPMLAAIFHISGERPKYLGVQKNPPMLALCPPTPACISTSEELNDPSHYVPPWTYNPEDGRGRRNPASKEQAMQELVDTIQNTNCDDFKPRIVKKLHDYVYVEYESPIFGFVDDVEFWFPPSKQSLVEYRSASRFGQFDFDKNRKRIKALRLALEKKGWESIGF